MTARTFSVCVFCGSREGRDPTFRKAAAELGAGIAQRGWRLVYGGGEIGIMGALAAAAHEGGADVLGIMPRRLIGREAGSQRLAQLVLTDTMFERKQRMFAESDAFIVLPGGFGTLDELLEVMTLKQLGFLAAPLFIIDVAGVWTTLFAAFAAVVEHGFADAAALGLYEVTDSVGAALTTLERAASS